MIASFEFGKVARDIVSVSVNLFKIMIPTLIIVKIAEEFGLDDVLVYAFQPLMSLMDLPAIIAVVLVTTMLTNPYTGLIVAASIPEVGQLSVGQASVMALFMLFTHSLPLEAMISRRVGVRFRVVIIIRVGTAFISGILLGQFFAISGLLSEAVTLNLPQLAPSSDIREWVVGQAGAIIMIQIVIIVLLILLELLRIIGVERLMIWLLSPFLRLMGIGSRASTIAIVGVSLGLGFGGGLLMKDVGTGTISKRDVFGVVCFINLIHSVFEDTAVVLLLGPSLFVILAIRFIISVLVTIIFMAFANRLSEAHWKRFLTNKNIPESAG